MSPQPAAHAVGQAANAESCTWLKHVDSRVPLHHTCPRMPIPDIAVKIVGLDDGHDLPPGELGGFNVFLQVPSEVEFRSELPKSVIDKILRRVLQEEETSKTKQTGGAHVLICAKNDFISNHTNTKEAK